MTITIEGINQFVNVKRCAFVYLYFSPINAFLLNSCEKFIIATIVIEGDYDSYSLFGVIWSPQ